LRYLWRVLLLLQGKVKTRLIIRWEESTTAASTFYVQLRLQLQLQAISQETGCFRHARASKSSTRVSTLVQKLGLPQRRRLPLVLPGSVLSIFETAKATYQTAYGSTAASGLSGSPYLILTLTCFSAVNAIEILKPTGGLAGLLWCLHRRLVLEYTMREMCSRTGER